MNNAFSNNITTSNVLIVKYGGGSSAGYVN